MATVKWPQLPSGTSNVGLGAGDVRFLKQQVQTGLEAHGQFLNVDSPVQMGAAKSLTTTTALLFDDSKATIVWQYENVPIIRSDTSRMYSYASISGVGGAYSSCTFLLGTPGYEEVHNTAPTTATWVERSDWTAIAADGTHRTSFGTVYDGVPSVFLTVSYGSSPVVLAASGVWLSDVTPGGFEYIVNEVRALTSSALTLNWMSYGTITRPA